MPDRDLFLPTALLNDGFSGESLNCLSQTLSKKMGDNVYAAWTATTEALLHPHSSHDRDAIIHGLIVMASSSGSYVEQMTRWVKGHARPSGRVGAPAFQVAIS